MKRALMYIVLITTYCSCNSPKLPAGYVDPFIGTDGHGHTFPGATLPFGMVQLSPDTRIDSWDGCSGYHYSDSTILGFSHTHLSGTGVGDYGDIRFMPTTGHLQTHPGTEDNPETGYRSRFSHENEIAHPGYYSVLLEDYNIKVELTATDHSGFQKYTFPESDNAHIIIDLLEGVTSDKIRYLEIEFISDTEIAGVRSTDGWADHQRVFFYSVFSRPFDDFGVIKNEKVFKRNRTKIYGDSIKAYVNYNTSTGEVIYVKTGISAVDINGARQNLVQEIPDWSFNNIKKKAEQTWNKQLGKIEVKGDYPSMTVFYTALYHSFIAPNLFMDVDGRYRGHDGLNYQSDKFQMYTVFSLWDTYRATHPLFTLIERERSNDFILSMLDMYEKGGLLPVWELAGNETNCMIGYHAVSVIADAYIKGVDNYNARMAYDAMRKSSLQDHFGLDAFRRYGYIPADKSGSSISRTLEYAYDDWCIARMAKLLDQEDDYRKYLERAQYYKNIFDPETGFLRGKRNAMFTQPFDPMEVNFMLTEANTWQYTFYVPHDISGLMELMGGKEAFADKLDEMFTTEPHLTGRIQPDITGMIGQYAHGNEPSHHMAYLYNYAGVPWKTQETVHKIMNLYYTDQPDGLCGNEDCGQMSAWYVLSALGFYPVTPGDTIYAIGTPVFKNAKINLENGNTFEISTDNRSITNYYIQSATLNGKEFNRSYLTQNEIMDGGKLVFKMGNTPNYEWGVGENETPVSKISDHLITPVPYVDAPSHAFSDEITIGLKNTNTDAVIYYTLDGSEPSMGSLVYNNPFNLNKTTTIRAFAVAGNKIPSKMTEAEFVMLPPNRTVKLYSEYSNQYTGGGPNGLIDGIRASSDYSTNGWQGYQGVDFDAVIDLGSVQKIRTVSSEYLQTQRSWIFLPVKVKYFSSLNGNDFQLLGVVNSMVEPAADGEIIKNFTLENLNINTRYIRVVAENIKNNPGWHRSPGGSSWIFVDEVFIK